MHKEIGSDFWLVEKTDILHEYNYGSDTLFLLSGRTALDFIIKEIKAKREVKAAYLPSYCCHTMIEPFYSNGIQVCFYDVVFENNCLNIKADENIKCDMALVLQYFGYQDSAIASISKKLKDMGMVIIEDCTHSLFSGRPFSNYADYTFASFRKWSGFECGAFASSARNNFSIKRPTAANEKYIKMRANAMQEKSSYITGIIKSKDYLSKFGDAEQLLEEDYSFYNVESDTIKCIQSWDIEFVKSKRKENAKTLTKLLSGIETVNLLFPEVSDDACPLFVPVYVKGNKRNELRKYLIEHSVYCPVHWPLSKFHKLDKPQTLLYENELSLICDQRYDMSDMEYISGLIFDFFRK